MILLIGYPREQLMRMGNFLGKPYFDPQRLRNRNSWGSLGMRSSKTSSESLPVSLLSHGVDVRRHILQLAFFEHLDDFFWINGQVCHGVDVDNGWAGVGVNKVVAVTLPENVEDWGLVKIPISRKEQINIMGNKVNV